MSTIPGADSVRSARRRFLSFLGGAAATTLTPAAVATARPQPDDSEFLRLYEAYDATGSCSDVSRYQEEDALRQVIMQQMLPMRVHTKRGVECKVEWMVMALGRVFYSMPDVNAWAEGALRDLRALKSL